MSICGPSKHTRKLSCKSTPVPQLDTITTKVMFHVIQSEHLSVNPRAIQQETRRYYLLSKVGDNITHFKSVNSQSHDQERKPYFTRHGKLLDELHQGLFGVVKMKHLCLVARDRLSHVPDFKKQALPAALCTNT